MAERRMPYLRVRFFLVDFFPTTSRHSICIADWILSANGQTSTHTHARHVVHTNDIIYHFSIRFICFLFHSVSLTRAIRAKPQRWQSRFSHISFHVQVWQRVETQFSLVDEDEAKTHTETELLNNSFCCLSDHNLTPLSHIALRFSTFKPLVALANYILCRSICICRSYAALIAYLRRTGTPFSSSKRTIHVHANTVKMLHCNYGNLSLNPVKPEMNESSRKMWNTCGALWCAYLCRDRVWN